MRIAIFMAQTDTSDYARQFPDDGEKFAALLGQARPGWRYDVHRVAFGEFPESLEADAGLITGSIASVNGGEDWLPRMVEIVREFDAARRPLYGACFGHQLIAHALGGEVGANPKGWIFGVAETMHADSPGWMAPPKPLTLLHAAHSEQVLHLPPGAEVLGASPRTPVAAMAVGRHIASTQYHPEMDRGFQRGLVGLLRGTVPDAVLDAALADDREVDNELYARWIARFFETAHQ